MENVDETGVTQSITLRPDDLDDLLTRAAERGAERCLAHLGLETVTPRAISANCAICWKRGAMPAARRGRPPSRS